MLQQQLETLNEQSQALTKDNERLADETKLAVKEKKDACQALIKMDEARVVLNKLLGP